jgi:hypothetical protein
MEHKLISYVILISFVLATITFIITGFYTNFFDALGILVGTIWSSTNLYFLKKLFQELLKIGSQNPLKLYTLIGIKFPLLYLIGYGVLKWKLFPLLNLILGFSVMLIAIFLLGMATLLSSKVQANIGSKAS